MLSDFSYTMISPINGGGDFFNTCNQILDFQTQEYEVCVQDMLFLPGAWQNVRNEYNTFKLLTANAWNRGGVDQWMTNEWEAYPELVKKSYKSKQHREIEFTLKPDFYYDRRVFIQAINDVIIAGVAEDGVKNPSLIKLNGYFVYDSTEIHSEDSPDKKHHSKVTGQVRFIASDPLKITRIEFCKELSFLLGITSMLTAHIPSLKHGWEIELSNIDLHRNNLTLIWVLADFVGTTMIGNMKLPILRMVPIQAGSGLFEHSIFALQNYVPVKRRQIQNLGISIRDKIHGCNNESLITLDRIIITLHFRLRHR